MRAAVLTAPGRIEVRDVRRPRAGAGEVLVRIKAVGLCGTDLHIFSGEANYNRDERGRVVPLSDHPQILGHEIAGTVEEVGKDVRDLRAGDRVIVDQGRTCVGDLRMPRCEYCTTGDSHQCAFYREHGITGLQGGLADCLVVPAVNAVALQSDLALDVAALTEPVGCVIHSCRVLIDTAARYRMAGRADERRVRAILLCGAGPAGLVFIQYLRRVMGFDGTLLVSEPNAAKRARAVRAGAEAIDPTLHDLADAVQSRTDGRRVELLIEASGSGTAFAAIPSLIRKQGTVLLYGHGHAGVDLTVLNSVQFMEPTLVSPVGASGGYEADGRPSTYLSALRLIERGVIDVASLITHRYPTLDSVPAAFAGDHRASDYLKGVVTL
ncbi:MAG: zinc-dependent dehydrogenase [Gemmatimonadaceae bacterium]